MGSDELGWRREGAASAPNPALAALPSPRPFPSQRRGPGGWWRWVGERNPAGGMGTVIPVLLISPLPSSTLFVVRDFIIRSRLF